MSNMLESYDEAKYRKFLEQHKGEYETVLWSGHTDGIGGEDNANNICKEHNENLTDNEKPWKTNEMLLYEAKMQMPEYNPSDPVSVRKWESTSIATVENASGQAHVIKGEQGREESIYSRLERERLGNNQEVNQYVDFIDPKSHEHIGMYDKSNLPDFRHTPNSQDLAGQIHNLEMEYGARGVEIQGLQDGDRAVAADHNRYGAENQSRGVVAGNKTETKNLRNTVNEDA